MSQRFRMAMEKAWKNIEERQWVYGQCGRINSDGTYTFDVPGRPGFIYVTVRNGAGAQTVVPARNDASVPHAPRLNIKLRLEKGLYVIAGKSGRSELGSNPPSLPSGIEVHDHDDIYYRENEHLILSAGAADAGKPIALDADGHIDATMINDADIDHTAISNRGTNTHAQIDSHLANTSNPHGVTKTQVGLSNVDNVQQMPLSYLDLDKTLTANSDVKVPSQKAIKFYVDNILSNANALVYKDTINCSTNPNYPMADAGFLYIVSAAGKIGGASGITVDVGDMLICNQDGASSGDQATVGAYWNIIEKNIIGAVTGPASATNGNMALFDGTTGKTLKNGSPPPENTPAVANNFITAYTSSTGAFTQARPTWADINKATSSIADITTKTHSLLSSLTADDHTQYALLAGRSGGQNLIGGTAANNALTLQANSATTGNTGTTNVFFVKTGNSGGTNAIIATNEGRVNIPVSLSIGGTPADAGELRLQNNQFVTVRNAANTGNVDMIRVNSSDKVQFGTGVDLGNQSLTGAYSIEQWTSSNWKFDNVGNGYVAGNFGIGTTAPLTKLHISDNNVTNGAYIYLERNDTALTSGEVLGRIAWATNDTDVTTNRLGAEIVVQAVNGGAADAFSTRMIFKTLPNVAASAMVEAFRITETQDIQIADTADIIVGTTTGTKIGTATTQKLGFYGATPIVRPGAYTQTYSTANKTIANISIQTLTAASGTGDTTVADVGTAFNQTTLNNNFKDLANQINNAVTDITDLKQAVNAIIDDLQNLGLVG